MALAASTECNSRLPPGVRVKLIWSVSVKVLALASGPACRLRLGTRSQSMTVWPSVSSVPRPAASQAELPPLVPAQVPSKVSCKV